MNYPDPGGSTATTVRVGNAIHSAVQPLAHTGISWLPLIAFGAVALLVGVGLTVWAALRKPVTFPWEG